MEHFFICSKLHFYSTFGLTVKGSTEHVEVNPLQAVAL